MGADNKQIVKAGTSLFAGLDGVAEAGAIVPVSKADRVVMEFPVTGKVKTWELRATFCRELIGTFSERGPQWVGVELKKARLWCVANPTKRKTEKGMQKFLANWLTKAADKPSYGPSNAIPETDDDRQRKLAALAAAKKRGSK